MARKKAAVATGNNELHLKAIEVLSSTLTPPVETKSGDVDYLFDIGIEHRVSESERLVFVVVSVVIRADGLPESLGSLTASCIFRIDNLEEVVIPGPDNGVEPFLVFLQEYIENRLLGSTRQHRVDRGSTPG